MHVNCMRSRAHRRCTSDPSTTTMTPTQNSSAWACTPPRPAEHQDDGADHQRDEFVTNHTSLAPARSPCTPHGIMKMDGLDLPRRKAAATATHEWPGQQSTKVELAMNILATDHSAADPPIRLMWLRKARRPKSTGASPSRRGLCEDLRCSFNIASFSLLYREPARRRAASGGSPH
jgi:hypothetical protein